VRRCARTRFKRETEREVERERQRETERDSETERDRERQTERVRETETDRDRQRQTETDRQTDRQTGQADRQADKRHQPRPTRVRACAGLMGGVSIAAPPPPLTGPVVTQLPFVCEAAPSESRAGGGGCARRVHLQVRGPAYP
jgi:hypothetical protein